MRLVFCGAASIDEHAIGCLKFCLIDHDRRGWRVICSEPLAGEGDISSFAFVVLLAWLRLIVISHTPLPTYQFSCFGLDFACRILSEWSIS